MSLSLNSSNELCEWVLPGFFIMFVSTDEPLLCFLQVCCSVAEIITKSVQFLPTVSWGCRYPPYNPVSNIEIWNVIAQGLHVLKEQRSCNLSFLYSISGGQRKSWIWCPTFSLILFTIRKKFKLGREIRCEYYQKRIWEEMFIEHEQISKHWTMMFLFDTLYNSCFVWIPMSINEDKQIFKGSFNKILKK